VAIQGTKFLMRAGKLKHLVTIQSPAGTRDAVGERTTSWVDVDDVMAAIMPVKVEERFVAPQLRGSITHKLHIRYSSEIAGVDSTWRVVYGARAFTIDGVRDIEERHHMVELLCTEGLREE